MRKQMKIVAVRSRPRKKQLIRAVVTRCRTPDESLCCLRAEGGARVAWDGKLLTYKKRTDYEKSEARFVAESDAVQFAAAHGFVLKE